MSFYLVKTSNLIQKMVVFYRKIIEKHEKKVVFYGKLLKIHGKVVKIIKKLV